MTTIPRSRNHYESFPDRSPSPRYLPSIRNSSDRDSVFSRVSSLPTINEIDRYKTPSGTRSPVYTLNEDPPISTSRAPLYPFVGGPSTRDHGVRDYNEHASNTGLDAPAGRPSAYFDPSQLFPMSFPVLRAQSDTSAGDASLVS